MRVAATRPAATQAPVAYADAAPTSVVLPVSRTTNYCAKGKKECLDVF